MRCRAGDKVRQGSPSKNGPDPRGPEPWLWVVLKTEEKEELTNFVFFRLWPTAAWEIRELDPWEHTACEWRD